MSRQPDFLSASGDPVIVGSGLAGLMTALSLAPRPCLLLSTGPLGGQSSSGWAQGGIAAAIGADDDAALHAADTLAAGAGLCDPVVVRRITGAAPRIIERLGSLGVPFDRLPDGRLALGLEAAHARHRIVHAGGDASGREIVRALVQAVRATPSIRVLEEARLVRLLLSDGAVTGALLRIRGAFVRLRSTGLVIATGGAGGLFLDTTNPLGATGSGAAIAARAGAALADIEFVQFHPTALATGDGRGAAPLPLVSEAVRGEGALLVDETGSRFMDSELAPRDVVARAVWRHLALGHRVFLDARRALGSRFAARFPAIAAICRAHGIEPATMPIPIRPAAHYHMGGIAVDVDGRSSLDGLWACGEAACTGLHGANRLASNSLLEAAVCGEAVAHSLLGRDTPPRRSVRLAPEPVPPPEPEAALPVVRAVMSREVGVLRDAAGLARARDRLAPLAPDCDAALLGLMIAQAALSRSESRGGHSRDDCPATEAEPRRSRSLAVEALALRGPERRAS